MMSFLTLRIWQAYAFEHLQFWQRIDAPAKDENGHGRRKGGKGVPRVSDTKVCGRKSGLG